MTNVETIKALYDAFAKGDIPNVLAAMDPKIEWIEADGFPYAGTYVGPDAVVQGVFARIGADFEGYQVAPDEVLDAGDTIVGLGHYSGRYKATGKDFRAPFAHVFNMRDGKVVRFRQYTDTVLVQAALR